MGRVRRCLLLFSRPREKMPQADEGNLAQRNVIAVPPFANTGHRRGFPSPWSYPGNLAQVLGVHPVAADCCGLSCQDEGILSPFSHLWEKVARRDG
jgi:hypothetical protein